jgi:ribosome maturation factor RimP
MAHDLKAQLTDLVSREADARGYELVLLETAGGSKSPIVRVYLDHEGGITIDQIAQANSWIDEILDARVELQNGYTLEVSSPGIDRPLAKLVDFARFAGQEAKVSVSREIDGHKHFTGTLKGVEDEEVLLEEGGTDYRIPLGSITTARLKGHIDFSTEGTADDGI